MVRKTASIILRKIPYAQQRAVVGFKLMIRADENACRSRCCLPSHPAIQQAHQVHLRQLFLAHLLRLCLHHYHPLIRQMKQARRHRYLRLHPRRKITAQFVPISFLGVSKIQERLVSVKQQDVVGQSGMLMTLWANASVC